MTLNKVMFFLFSLSLFSHGFAQNQGKDTVRLVHWDALDCDNTYDSYRIKNRISNVEKSGDLIKITINFSENCCAEFDPAINFVDNKLYLLPFTKKSDVYCACDCCFSIEYDISGLNDKNFEIYFKDKKVEYSENYYDTISPSFETFQDEIINRTNKYGFMEGKWMSFYDDCSINSIRVFPPSVLYFEAYPLWTKLFYQNGKLAVYDRNDTVQEWFEDGTIQYESYEYSVGDTTFKYVFSLYDNRNLRVKSLQKDYPVIHRSKYNDCYEAKGSKFPYVYKEEYYENGQSEFILGKDTTKKWYRNGQLKEIYFDSGGVEYDSLGRITEKKFFWDSPGSECSMDLRNSLVIIYDNNLNVKEIRLNRDEVREKGIGMGANYYWKWDANGKLIKSPENWKEELPWKRFKEIEIPLSKN